eukprot:75349-Pyramimonas_sp.AAC.1
MTYLRLASQELTTVATVSHIASPPRGRRGTEVIRVGCTSGGLPRSPRKWRQLRTSQTAREKRREHRRQERRMRGGEEEEEEEEEEKEEQ